MTLMRPLQVTEEGAEVAAADEFAAYDTDGSGVRMRVARRCGGVRALRALARETSMLQPQSCIHVCLYIDIHIYTYRYMYICVYAKDVEATAAVAGLVRHRRLSGDTRLAAREVGGVC